MRQRSLPERLQKIPWGALDQTVLPCINVSLPLPGRIDAGAAPGGDERSRTALRQDVAGAAAGLPRAGVSSRVAVHRNGDEVFGDASITGRAVRRCAAGRLLTARLV